MGKPKGNKRHKISVLGNNNYYDVQNKMFNNDRNVFKMPSGLDTFMLGNMPAGEFLVTHKGRLYIKTLDNEYILLLGYE